jgi:arginase family enzyme
LVEVTPAYDHAEIAPIAAATMILGIITLLGKTALIRAQS